jgi:hypothetical protein
MPSSAQTPQATKRSDESGRVLRQLLLAAGIISALLYALTDFVGGRAFPGYSFASRGISELMAVGAPSEGIVDPLFLAYGAFVVLFAVGLLMEASTANRPLRVVGVLLLLYALCGLTGPTLFEIPQRGSGEFSDAIPHVVLTASLVFLSLAAILVGAFALDHRFRAFSFAMFALSIAGGALAATFGDELARNQPTPGLGIFERVGVYASLAWMAVLAIALLRRSSAASRSATPLHEAGTSAAW